MCRHTMFMGAPSLFQDWGAFCNLEHGLGLLQTAGNTRLVIMWRPAPLRSQSGGSKMPLVPHERRFAVL